MPDESIWEEEPELTEREDVRSDRARGSVDGPDARKRPPRKPDISRSVSSGSEEAAELAERGQATDVAADSVVAVPPSSSRSASSEGSAPEDGDSSGAHRNHEETPGADDLCPRWMYHRKGVWCKTCFHTPSKDGVMVSGWSLEGRNLGISEGMTVKTNFKSERKPKKRGNR